MTMNDEQVTNPVKTRGRGKTYTNAEAAIAYDLYVVKNLTGEQVGRALKKPRTTIIGMARLYESALNLAAKLKSAPASEQTGGVASVDARTGHVDDSTAREA